MKKIALPIISFGLIFALGLTPSAMSADWVASSSSPTGYQPVKAFVPEDKKEPNDEPSKDPLKEEESKAVRDAAEAVTADIKVQNQTTSALFETQAERSSEILKFQERVEYKKEPQIGEKLEVSILNNNSSESREIGGNQQNPSAQNSESKESPITSGKTEGAEDTTLGFLATQNSKCLSRVEGDSDAKKKALKNNEGALGTQTETQLTANPTTVYVVDSVRFSDKFRMIYELMNPPENLHPWLKWLLYSSRLNQEMMSFYYKTVKKRDEIYQKALNSNGQLAVFYKNRIYKDIPFYVMSEWANGDYSLVQIRHDIMVRKNNSPIPVS